MTIQDLKNNRDRIIKNITYKGGDVKYIMELMVKQIEVAIEVQEMKPLMKNIDKLTNVCYDFWLNNIYEPVVNIQTQEDIRLESVRNQSVGM